MNIVELIAELQDMVSVHGEDLNVALATQPNYPLQHSVGGVSCVESDEDEDVKTVYIFEGSGESGYAPRDAFRM